MSNPFESPRTTHRQTAAWYRRPYVIAGLSCLAVAGLLLVVILVLFVGAYQEAQVIADSNPSATPNDVAKPFMLPAFLITPAMIVGILGIVMTIAGLYPKKGKK